MTRGGQKVDRREMTRRALIEAAINRFAENGVAGTGVAEIAGDAGVTERTFYRHFANKEEVLFADYDDRIDWFRRALEVRPRTEPITRSVRYAVDAFPMDHRLVAEAARLRTSELTEQQVGKHMQRVQAALASEIEYHLREKADGDPVDDLTNSVSAAIIAAAVFAALTAWGRRGADLDALGPMVEKALAAAEAGVAALATA
ncbi:TetR/AcrR family transcriptional regulator [Mycobacterium syngnathidarum]